MCSWIGAPRGIDLPLSPYLPVGGNVTPERKQKPEHVVRPILERLRREMNETAPEPA